VNKTTDRVVQLGRICGIHGVRGWVRLESYTEPRTNLTQYQVWLLDDGTARSPVRVSAVRQSGKHLIAKIDGIDDRDAAAVLVGAEILVPREQLPPCDPGELYWTDLEGLEVRTLAGEVLGRIARLMATGANDVIVLDGPGNRLIPFVPGRYVHDVDLEAGIVSVDWDASYWE